MQILIPLDGSPLAERALISACTLAARAPLPSSLILLRAIPYPNLMLGAEALSPVATSVEILEEATNEANSYLQSVRHEPRFASFEMHTRVECGDPAITISAVAQELAVDLVIMTTHGRTGLSHLLLGSVAEAVSRHTHIPVLLIRATGEDFATQQPLSTSTILVPLDGTPFGESTIGPATQLARLLGDSLTLLRVVPEKPKVAIDTKAEALAYLTSWQARLNALGVTVQLRISSGDSTQQILAQAQEQQVALVVLATHGRSIMGRLSEGSMAETVLHHMHIPLLSVHPPLVKPALMIPVLVTR